MNGTVELLLYLYAESPVHAGASDALDVVDLPIQREATTGYPVIWGQSLKGALRQAATEAWPENDGMVAKIFGRAVDGQRTDATEAGLLAVGDAQLVAMPVPTLRRTFAWATSQIALARLARKYTALGLAEIPSVPKVADDRAIAAGEEWLDHSHQVFGPCVLTMERPASRDLRVWAERLAGDAIGKGSGLAEFGTKLRDDLILVGADAMPLLLRECTELTARVQLNAGKTVSNGPFYSEYLPAESILAAPLTLRGGRKEHLNALLSLLHGALHQIGGDETLGKGLVWTRLLEAGR